ncbi:MAG: hypothetical protein EOP49_33900 [Sphingobacteriales bacterium]|nr:MAG: hypothetical protein EOP49_33900 [Sphingobacteriales bacterium]
MNTNSDDTSVAVSDWSKWITGISLFSVSGCISVLVTKGVGAKNIINIKLAIVFFLVTIIIAWLVQLTLALKKRGAILSILIMMEILLFCLSSFYLAKWVWQFPANPPVTKQVVIHITVQKEAYS